MDHYEDLRNKLEADAFEEMGQLYPFLPQRVFWADVKARGAFQSATGLTYAEAGLEAAPKARRFDEDGVTLIFQVKPGEEPWAGALPGWYIGLADGDSEGPYETLDEAEDNI